MQEFFDLKVTPYSPRNNNLLRLPKANTSRYRTQPLPLDETHLVVVRGLPTKKFQPKCVNEESSTERRSYNRQL